MRRRSRPIVAVALMLFGSALLRAQTPAASDPFNGTWKLNAAKSTFNSGPPPPDTTIDVRTFSTMEGGWHTFVLVGITAQGEPTSQILTYKIDGKPYPVHNATTLARLLALGEQTTITRSYRRIDPSTVEFITYTDGVAGLPGRRTVAKDGKTYTQTIQARNAQGKIVDNISLFERVR